MDLPNTSYNNSLNNFCIVGINYRKSDVIVRGKFSLSPEQSAMLLEQAVSKEIPACLVLSTCNRTELYGLCENPHELVEMHCTYVAGNVEEFLNHGYIYRGISAIEHLFKVASGLDSQIIGDYEILSQIKQAAKVAKHYGCINSFMERAINYALQVSKEIKTKTKLSSGTVSVSYAAIELIKEKIQDISNKKILLVGTGKFGNQIAKNLKYYLPGSNILFTNRTDKKALELSMQYNSGFVSYKNLPASCDDADVVVVSSTASSFTILPQFFTTNKPRLILDLSIPQNVEPSVKDMPGITLLNVDEVSTILDKTISRRQAEVPKAMKIIEDTLNSLADWHRQQANNPLLIKVKSQIVQLTEAYFNNNYDEEKIHKTVSFLAIQLKNKKNKGCQCINALSSYLQTNYEKTP
jgi:glutamyl-tRNA reductase